MAWHQPPPHIFTKLLKSVYASLRNLGHIVSGYIDNSYLQGDDVKSCKENVSATHSTFTNLGFLPHEEKSVVEPTQEGVCFELINHDHLIDAIKGTKACECMFYAIKNG